MYATEAT